MDALGGTRLPGEALEWATRARVTARLLGRLALGGRRLAGGQRPGLTGSGEGLKQGLYFGPLWAERSGVQLVMVTMFKLTARSCQLYCCIPED